jgi:hypothetical protein
MPNPKVPANRVRNATASDYIEHCPRSAAVVSIFERDGHVQQSAGGAAGSFWRDRQHAPPPFDRAWTTTSIPDRDPLIVSTNSPATNRLIWVGNGFVLHATNVTGRDFFTYAVGDGAVAQPRPTCPYHNFETCIEELHRFCTIPSPHSARSNHELTICPVIHNLRAFSRCSSCAFRAAFEDRFGECRTLVQKFCHIFVAKFPDFVSNR